MTMIAFVLGFTVGLFGAMTVLDELGVEPGLALILTILAAVAAGSLSVAVFA